MGLLILIASFSLIVYPAASVMDFDNGKKLERLENTVKCLDEDFRYRKRPKKLMEVESQVAILSIDAISSAKMELSSNVYLEHEWTDHRCIWQPLRGQGFVVTLYARPGEGSTWTHKGLNNLWQPDTQVLNAKSLSRPETVTNIQSAGIVQSRTRLSLTTSCPMDLKLYPMDRQMCALIFQSSAHHNEEVTYKWKNQSKLTFIHGLPYQDRMTPDLKILGFRLDLQNFTTDAFKGNGESSNYTQFIVRLYLERPIGFFIWEVYMPASFIVTMSFTSFWLDRSATPARVSLGVTTVLTMTTLLSSANKNLPATSYPKSIGVFLAGCFLFTFFALMEYSVASYLERRSTAKRLIKMSRQRQADKSSRGEGEENYNFHRRPTLAHLRETISGLRPAAVDVYSRVIFPLAFVAFHMIYWITCYASLEPLPPDVILLDRS